MSRRSHPSKLAMATSPSVWGLAMASVLSICADISPAQPTQFVLHGEISAYPANDVLALYQELVDEQSARLDIILHPRSIEMPASATVEVNDHRQYRTQVEISRAREGLIIRAISNNDLISNSDYVLEKSELDQALSSTRGSLNFRKDVILTTRANRFIREMDAAERMRDAGNLEAYFGQLRIVMKNIVGDNVRFYYRVGHRLVEVLYASFQQGASVNFRHLAFVHEVERSPLFDQLDERQKHNFFIQAGRALYHSPFRATASLEGEYIWQTAERYLLNATLLLDRDAPTSRERFILFSDLASLLREARQPRRAIEGLKAYFEPITRQNRETISREFIISMLVEFVRSINRIDDMLTFTDEEYVAYAAQSWELRSVWKEFYDVAEPWSFLFPPDSKTREGKMLRRYFDIAEEILSDEVLISGRL